MADLIDKIAIQARRNDYLKKSTTAYENVGALVDEKSLAAGFVGTLVTRHNDTEGLVDFGGTDVTSLNSHHAGLGWVDTNGVFRCRMHIELTQDDVDAFEFTAGTGTVLPLAGTQISLNREYEEKISHDSSLKPLLAKTETPGSAVGLLMGSLAAIGLGTYTATIVLPLEWEKDLILASTGFTALNSSYVGADRAYVANLSIPPVPTKVTVIPFNS